MSSTRIGFTCAAALVLVVCLVAMLVDGRGSGVEPAPATRILAG